MSINSLCLTFKIELTKEVIGCRLFFVVRTLPLNVLSRFIHVSGNVCGPKYILLFCPHFLISGLHLQWLRSIVVIEIRVCMKFGYIECSRILISCAENYPPVVRRICCAKHPRTLIASRSPPADSRA